MYVFFDKEMLRARKYRIGAGNIELIFTYMVNCDSDNTTEPIKRTLP